MLGQAQQLGDNIEAARVLHHRAPALASRIGHAAAMCEALEDLARTEADEQPMLAATFLRAARAERVARGIPLRQRDAEDLVALEMTLPATDSIRTDDRPFALLIAELTA